MPEEKVFYSGRFKGMGDPYARVQNPPEDKYNRAKTLYAIEFHHREAKTIYAVFHIWAKDEAECQWHFNHWYSGLRGYGSAKDDGEYYGEWVKKLTPASSWCGLTSVYDVVVHVLSPKIPISIEGIVYLVSCW